MNQNGKFTEDDLVVDQDIQIDDDIGQEIIVYFECWFDVDEKFNINTASDENAWLNMYGRYNPFEDTLSVECEIDREDSSSWFDYIPTESESQLMKDLIAARIQKEYNQTPKEFCEQFFDEDLQIGGM